MKKIILLLLLFLTLNAFSQSTSGTQLYLKFEGNVNDYSGNNITCTPTSLTYDQTHGKLRYGAYFSSGRKLSLGDPTALRFGTGAFTVSFWFYTTTLTGLNSNQSQLINKDPDGSSFYIVLNSTGKLSVANIFTTGSINSNITIQINKWYHVLFTRSASGTANLYVNGVLDTTATGTNKDISAIGTPWTIATSNNSYLYGGMDELRLINIEWTYSQVKNYHLLTSPKFSF